MPKLQLIGFDHVTAYYMIISGFVSYGICIHEYNINITLLDMYQIPFRFPLPLQKAILADEENLFLHW